MRRKWLVFILGINLAGGLWAQNAPGERSYADRPVSWKGLLPNIANDQGRIWTYPLRLVKGSHWEATLSVLTVAAALVASDPITAGHFRNTTAFHGFNSVFTGSASALGTVVAPASLYVAGLIRKDSYQKNTALLAGEAVADAEILTTVLKSVDRRVRPAALPATTKYGDTWFESKGSLLRGNGSFPSGHTIAAFSVATVMSRRYGPRHRWVPYVAYGLATAVGFSRISLSAHFASDVFMGAAMGYSIARFSVLHQ